MQIRSATIGDYRKIHRFIQTAFTGSAISDGQEHNWVISQRSTASYLPELEFIAEQNGKLIGYLLLTKYPIVSEHALWLAPLCVQKEYRKQGIGRTLLHFATQKATMLGYHAVFLIGHPAYYGKFGFRSVAEFQIQNCSPIPDPYVQVLELIPDTLAQFRGQLYLSA